MKRALTLKAIAVPVAPLTSATFCVLAQRYYSWLTKYPIDPGMLLLVAEMAAVVSIFVAVFVLMIEVNRE